VRDRARDSFAAMPNHSLKDGAEAFDVTLLEAATPARVVLFAVGGGGNPERHLPLLSALAADGCRVVAPHFERFTSPRPTEAQLLTRARRLRLALDSVARAGLPAVGVGHSIGATMLLALCGGRVWMGSEGPLPIAADARLERLVLLAPATSFFQAPAALDAVRAPIHAWAGTLDVITPVAQTQWLQQAIASGVAVEAHVCEGAGHFSFMHVPPPQTTEPLADRDAFLAQLTRDVCRAVSR
jgi:pimeloyl-ACP methyl ester carboxylesterase